MIDYDHEMQDVVIDPIALFPDSTAWQNGTLCVNGVSLHAVAAEHGTPLYVLDGATMSAAVQAFQTGLSRYDGEATIYYACKALLNGAVAQHLAQYGIRFDVVSANEMAVLLNAGIAPERLRLHGNGTPYSELRTAIQHNIGQIVLDNADQLAAVTEISTQLNRVQHVMLRVAPDIRAGGHKHIETGLKTSKFGFNDPIPYAQTIVASPHLQFDGFHAHLGSQIRGAGAIVQLVNYLSELLTAVPAPELCVGGGIAVPTDVGQPEMDIAGYCSALAAAVNGLTIRPRLSIEPGRAIVAKAGVALYRVTGRKRLDDGTTWLHVDGGMGDNPRPALYGALYHAVAIDKPHEPTHTYRVSGRYCESGDVLIPLIDLPEMAVGDVIAVPAAGAYTLSMASNYNEVGRPAVVFIDNGVVVQIQARETVQFDTLL